MAQATISTSHPRSFPHPARLSILCGTVGACVVLLFLALALPSFSGGVYLADDLGEFHLPTRVFYAESLARGQSFDWWPALFGGFYLTGEGQHGPYHPLHLALYRWLPLRAAFDLEVVLSYAWMLAGTYLWLRRRNLPIEAAIFGGLCFTFSGFNLLHLPHVNAIAILSQLPWLLWVIDIAISEPRANRRALATAAITLLTASQLLLGYPQYVWYCLLIEGLYAVWLLRNKSPSRQIGAPSRVRLAITLAGAVCVGFLLAGIQLLPTLDALGASTRKDAGLAFAEWGSLHPLNLVQLVAPYLFEHRVVGQNTHELGLYAGCVSLALCVWLWIRRTELAAFKSLAIFSSMIAIFALWMALGEYGFIYRIQTWLPIVGKFRFPCRTISLFHLAMAVLAAIAMALLATNQPSRLPLASKRYWPLWGLCGASVGVALVAVFFWPQHVAGWPAIVAGPILIFTAAILVWLADRNRPAALAALVLFAALDLGTYGLSYSVWNRTDRIENFASRIAAPSATSTGRVLAESPTDSKRGQRVGNAALLSGWERIDGYCGLEPSHRLDYRQTNALRVAGVDFASIVVMAEPLAKSNKPHASSLLALSKVSAPLPAVRLVAEARESSDPAHDIGVIDPEHIALVEPGFGQHYTLGEPAGSARIVEQAPGKIAVATQSAAANLLVVNQSWHNGWQAQIDGQRAKVERLYGDFFGCVVPPGSHQVDFEFHPGSLRYGAILSAMGLACLIVGTVWLSRGNTPRSCQQESHS